jgi:hypothetical protein
MANDWLPEGFENDGSAAPSRLVGGVRQRVQARRARIRTLQGGVALTALALILGAAPTLWRSFREAPQPAPQQVAQLKVEKPTWAPESAQSLPSSPAPQLSSSVSPSLPSSPAPQLSSSGSPSLPNSPAPKLSSSPSPDITIQKAPKGVELAWTGSPQKEYVVYRCTSPKFDQCSVAGTVKGNQWNDTGSDRAPVVFYKVEPKA